MTQTTEEAATASASTSRVGGMPRLPERVKKGTTNVPASSPLVRDDGGKQDHIQLQSSSNNGPSLPPRGAALKKTAHTTTAQGSSPKPDVPMATQTQSSSESINPNGLSAPSTVHKSSFMPILPPRQAPAAGPVLDPDESQAIQTLRRDIHTIRVSLIRAAQRLGYDHENGLVKQVLYRLNLAEKLKAPWKRGKRPDPASAASREASKMEQEQQGSALGFKVKMMLIGLTGSGKTQLINSLLHTGGVGRPAPCRPGQVASVKGFGAGNEEANDTTHCKLVDPFQGSTKHAGVVEGLVHGIHMVCIDTPGLMASAGAAAHNGKVLQQIRRAYHHHKPDLVVYVDRLDSPARPGGELSALKVLTESLGPGFWLNTIVALSHAGSPPPCGPKGQLPFETFANQRSHLLQQVIRTASGDSRLMNPTAFVESHPNCQLNPEGHAVICNGMAWKTHLYLMVVSAKLLADTENMLQMQDGSSGAGSAAANAAAVQQMMGAQIQPPRQLPLPYLVSSLSQFSNPLQYPDHAVAMDVRAMEQEAKGEGQKNPKRAREMVRQIKGRLLQLKQINRNKEKMQRSFKNATLAGGKVTPEPPRLATRRTPSVHPPGSFRYRVPEPAGGWIVRPHIETHGMDNSDGIEGLYLEKVGVSGRDAEGPTSGCSNLRRSTADLLVGGTPYRHFVSAQCDKEHRALQARSEGTFYHDPMGKTTSTLSADLQTSAGSAAGMDVLCTLRSDVQRQKVLGSGGRATLGVAISRLAEGGKPQHGPVALGMRLQQSIDCSVPGTGPAKLSAAGAYMVALPSSSSSLAASMDPYTSGELRDTCFGGNLEVATELQKLLRLKHSTPLTVAGNLVSYRGDVMTGLALGVQQQSSKAESLAGRVQLAGKGKAAVNLKVKSTEHWWAGLAAMVLPLGTLLLHSVGVLK
ncbi:hypothetical protein CEUSTIGMA_g2325.t1 [Chlamydomonas eustigma]|uniref:Translocase of chloroplast 159/132 membrane anchor domain-containing protein n=1 Tax=Chlamydomonas eustigma TaxID=1157962 RepID=A0A250WVZ6_9CHLO|nr:hypothetical protein CEUSTIGMA_g2325.t1 [Chlamydomonas eustigma]|eukprot:GAX74879.1 hypothetical protein CEUSTIGMA_g2325.t1 [Chlamydomonas eustigma]